MSQLSKYVLIVQRIPKTYRVVTLALALLFAVYAACYRPIIFPVDDAYITIHNAVVLTRGSDINYRGVPALVGATSIVHTSVVALLTLVFAPVWALEISLWLSILLYALGLAALARLRQMPIWMQAVLIGFGLIVGEMPHQLLNGLETGLALASVVWAFVFAITEQRVALSVLCGVMPFIRPELAAFSGMLLIRQDFRYFLTQERSAAVRACLVDLGYCFAGALPWLVLSVANTGSPLPSTIGAKEAFFAEATLPWSTHVEWFTIACTHFVNRVGFLSYFAVFLLFDSLGCAAALAMAAMLFAYLLRFPGALGHYEHRYLYVLLPFLFYAATSAWHLSRRYVRCLIAFCLILLASISAWQSPHRWRDHLNYCRFTDVELDGVAQFCNTHLPPGSKLLVHDAGYISYATKFPLIDLVGLKTPQAIPLHRQITLPSAGQFRNVAINELAVETRPDYIIVLTGWDRLFHITDGMRQQGWTMKQVRPTPAGHVPAYLVYEVRRSQSLSATDIAVRQ